MQIRSWKDYPFLLVLCLYKFDEINGKLFQLGDTKYLIKNISRDKKTPILDKKQKTVCIFVKSIKYIRTKTVYSLIFDNLNLLNLGYFCTYSWKGSVRILYSLKFSLTVNNALSIKLFTYAIYISTFRYDYI